MQARKPGQPHKGWKGSAKKRHELLAQRSIREWTDRALAVEAENEMLRAVIHDAGQYVVVCPPPPEATWHLRITLLECRERIAKAAVDLARSADLAHKTANHT